MLFTKVEKWIFKYILHIGKIIGEKQELDDGYTVNLQLQIYAEEVDDWMKVNVLV